MQGFLQFFRVGHTIHGTNGIFTYMNALIFYGVHVGKYTIPMDGMGCFKFFVWQIMSDGSSNWSSSIHDLLLAKWMEIGCFQPFPN